MSYLQHYQNPFGNIWDLGEEVNRLLWGIQRSSKEDKKATKAEWAPAVDIHEDKQSFTVRADLPGIKKEDLKINLRDGILTIQGERKLEKKEEGETYVRLEKSYGSFMRSFTLPKTVNGNQIQAALNDGVLEIVIPKLPEAQEKEISVQVK